MLGNRAGFRFATKSCEFGAFNKIKLEGDPEALTFGFMQLFDLTQPCGPAGSSKSHKRGVFTGFANKSSEFWCLT